MKKHKTRKLTEERAASINRIVELLRGSGTLEVPRTYVRVGPDGRARQVGHWVYYSCITEQIMKDGLYEASVEGKKVTLVCEKGKLYQKWTKDLPDGRREIGFTPVEKDPALEYKFRSELLRPSSSQTPVTEAERQRIAEIIRNIK